MLWEDLQSCVGQLLGMGLFDGAEGALQKPRVPKLSEAQGEHQSSRCTPSCSWATGGLIVHNSMKEKGDGLSGNTSCRKPHPVILLSALPAALLCWNSDTGEAFSHGWEGKIVFNIRFLKKECMAPINCSTSLY